MLRWKDKATDWKKILANCISDEVQISKIYIKNQTQLLKIPLEKGQKHMN